MYRLLAEHDEVRERRDQLTHPPYQKPELLATAPKQLWSWDITKLLGPTKWTYFYLYVILDLFSRYVVGWMVTLRESAELAKRLIEEGCRKQGIQPGQLTLHADRGTSMTSKPVAFLLADLGVTKTHSRPHVSNDNPYSESQFRTLKYRPEFPDRFGCIQDSRAFCQVFFSLVQRRTSSFELRPTHASNGALRASRKHLATTASRARRCLSASPGALRSKRTEATQLPSEVWIKRSTFDTVVMFGNNFGLFGSALKAKRLLKKLHKITTANALIVAESVNVYDTKDPVHLAYQVQSQTGQNGWAITD